jgi:type I restriction enzyme R subunit
LITENVAVELLEKLLGDEIHVQSKRNLVQNREFSEMPKKTLNAYHNRAVSTQEVIEELGALRRSAASISARTTTRSLFTTRSQQMTAPPKPWAKMS